MPDFPPPNYVDPHTRVPAIIGLAVVGLVVMLPFTVARLYVRYMRRIFWIDDWIIVAAAVCRFAAALLPAEQCRSPASPLRL
jgi:hypothetical protein